MFGLRWFAGPAVLAAILLLAFTSEPTSAANLVHITSHIAYDIRPDAGPVRISWDVAFANNDPSTQNRSGTISFYDRVLLPILRGASGLSASSSDGHPLRVTVDSPGPGPVTPATVAFDRRLFYQDSYNFKLTYELPQVREQSLLVTPFYAFVPAVAIGDEATVTISTPPDGVWKTSLESGECSQSEATFTCTGSDSIYLAALAEVSRPDATAIAAFDVPLKQKAVSVTLTYFRGDDAIAQHLKELVAAGLPIIEEQTGFAYSGPPALHISQGGRQVVLGYEGLTSCHAISACEIIVSPIADETTVLHEMSHLWSDIYARRWLAEGFAQLIAEEAAGRLPTGLVQRQPPAREPVTVDLQLDEWGDVTSIIGASQDKLAVQNAGYDRSLRFLYILRHDLGSSVLQKVNAAIAQSGRPADSKRYLDLVEETSGRVVDDLFAEWVFPRNFAPTLRSRREARDRLKKLERRAADEGLSDDIPKAIRQNVEVWRFDDALTALNDAEAGLADYEHLKIDLSALATSAGSAGLSLPTTINEATKRWDFAVTRVLLTAAQDALDAYTSAREKVTAPRSLWQRLGLLGRDPDGALARAGDAFAAGDFQSASGRAHAATAMIDGASAVAFRRLLILAAVLAVFAAGIGVAVWISRLREREFAGP